MNELDAVPPPTYGPGFKGGTDEYLRTWVDSLFLSSPNQHLSKHPAAEDRIRRAEQQR